MTVEKTPEKTSGTFTELYPYKYIQLTTFRKNGTAVPTPVWFATDQGKLYVLTINTAGKVKRIRNTARVVLAPCNASGKVLGEQVEARAREVSAAEYEHAIAVLARKYGFIYRVFTFLQNIRKAKRTYIEIEAV